MWYSTNQYSRLPKVLRRTLTIVFHRNVNKQQVYLLKMWQTPRDYLLCKLHHEFDHGVATVDKDRKDYGDDEQEKRWSK